MAGVQWIAHNLTQSEGLERLIGGVDAVVHVAGLAHVFGNVTRGCFFRVNADATTHMAAAAARLSIGTFVLVSSSSVYGPHLGVPTEESICSPDTPYGESKLAGEQGASAAVKKGGTRLTILRLATLYGAGDPGNVFRLMKAIDRHRFAWIGRGSNQKTLLHVSDAARAVIRALEGGSGSAPVFNVAGDSVPMREIVTQLADHLGRRILPFQIPGALVLGGAALAAKGLPIPRLRSMHATLSKWLNDDVYDGTLFAATFGFRPTVPLAEGLRDEVEWYRQRQRFYHPA